MHTKTMERITMLQKKEKSNKPTILQGPIKQPVLLSYVIFLKKKTHKC